MAGVSSPPSSSPSLFAPAQSPSLFETETLDCGHRSKDRFFRCAPLATGRAGPKIQRICPGCAGESFEATTGAGGLRGSAPASPAITHAPSTLPLAPAVFISSCDPRGSQPSIGRPRLAGRAPSSLPDPFKTLLQGVFSTALDWLLGTRAAVAGRSDERRLRCPTRSTR